MQFGKSLLGAIIGAAVGIALLLVVYLTMHLDKVWLSIPFAIITGLGVRMFVSTGGHASYVRGAMTMLIALAGYIGGWMIVAQVATARANAPSDKPPIAGEEKPAAEPGDTEAKDAAAPDEKQDEDAAPTAAPRQSELANQRATIQRNASYSPWDIICLAVAALVAYELGRGSGTSPAAGHTAQPMPGGTHPDA